MWQDLFIVWSDQTSGSSGNEFPFIMKANCDKWLENLWNNRLSKIYKGKNGSKCVSVASLAWVVCCPAVQLQSVTEASLAIHLIKFFLEFFQVYKRQKWEQVCDNLTCLVCLLPWRSTAKRDTGFKLNPIGTQSAALCGNNWSLEWEHASWNRINPKMLVTSVYGFSGKMRSTRQSDL